MIDLKKVFEYSPNSFQNRALLKSVLTDLYPEKQREINVLLIIHESGILEKIKDKNSVSEIEYQNYIEKIYNLYGTERSLIETGLKTWINEYFGYNIIKFSDPGKEKIDVKEEVVFSGDTKYFNVRELSNGVEIVYYWGPATDVLTIPSEINGKKVISIGPSSFEKCNKFNRVLIPNGIQYICYNAFAHNTETSEINLPETVKELGSHSLSGLAVSKIVIPSSVVKIYSFCFASCKKMKEVQLPKQLKVLNRGVFSGCESLERIELPQSLTTVNSFAFLGCRNLTDIKLNDGLLQIENEAFKGCEILREITIPSSVTKIAPNAFPENVKIKNYPNFKTRNLYY